MLCLATTNSLLSAPFGLWDVLLTLLTIVTDLYGSGAEPGTRRAQKPLPGTS